MKEQTEEQKAAALERKRVQWVFGLTGGELADEPWQGHPYWYEGIPDYLENPKDLYTSDVEYRTLVTDCYGMPGIRHGWEPIKTLSNSGETECPCKSEEDEREEDDTCELCEGDGIIYLGDGWREIVFRRET
jgi:hypothetical protein